MYYFKNLFSLQNFFIYSCSDFQNLRLLFLHTIYDFHMQFVWDQKSVVILVATDSLARERLNFLCQL